MIQLTLPSGTEVESALQGPMPRRVAWAPPMVRSRVWCINILVAAAMVIYYLYSHESFYSVMLSMIILMIALVVAVTWALHEMTSRNEYRLLREGIAVRAIVQHIAVLSDQQREIREISYRYQLRTGRIVERATQIVNTTSSVEDEFRVGSSFTVLYLPEETGIAMPYFQVTEVVVPANSKTPSSGRTP